MLLDLLADQMVPPAATVTERFERMGLNDTSFNIDETEVPEDSSVRQVVEQEIKYRRELWRLQKILRRTLSSDDPLPLFNRRHLLLLVRRVCKDLERSTSKLRLDMDMRAVTEVLEDSTPVSHGLLCIAWADTLFELRQLLKREMSRKNDPSICFCQELHAERALLPLHRLKYLKALTSFSSQHNELITSALDGCLEAISSLHSHSYVVEIDTLLDFSLNMDPPPKLYYKAGKNEVYQELNSSAKSADTTEEHVYEEIVPICPKPKKSVLQKFFSKDNKDISAQDEFIPLSNYTNKLRELFA